MFKYVFFALQAANSSFDLNQDKTFTNFTTTLKISLLHKGTTVQKKSACSLFLDFICFVTVYLLPIVAKCIVLQMPNVSDFPSSYLIFRIAVVFVDDIDVQQDEHDQDEQLHRHQHQDLGVAQQL